MFKLFRRSQADALAPLVELARTRHGYDRRVFLSELRRDAPTVAALIEHMLATEAATEAETLLAEGEGVSSVPATPAIRQETRTAESLSHVSSLSTTGG